MKRNVLLLLTVACIISGYSIIVVSAAGREGADSENDTERMVWAVLSLFYIFMMPLMHPEYDIMWMWIFCMFVLGCWARAGIAM